MRKNKHRYVRRLLFYQGTYLLLVGAMMFWETGSLFFSLLTFEAMGNGALVAWWSLVTGLSLVMAAISKSYQLPIKLMGLLTAILFFGASLRHYIEFLPSLPFLGVLLINSLLLLFWGLFVVRGLLNTVARIWNDPYYE